MTWQRRFFFLAIALLAQATATPTTSTTICYDSAQSLQRAITALPPFSRETPELMLCPSIVLEVTEPLIVQDRSLRLGCAAATGLGQEPLCTLRKSEGPVARLFQVQSTSSSSTMTVHLSQLRLENGESYHDHQDNSNDRGRGGAIFSKGANLILEDCRLVNNVASLQGGAISVQDNGKPILFLVTRTIFQENLSIEQEDCHSIFFHQDHPASMAELNTEKDFVVASTETSRSRRLQKSLSMDCWDDPAKAMRALQEYHPSAGTSLCV